MADKKKAVFGVYATRAAVEEAADTLVQAGLNSSDISVLLPENLGSKAIGTEKATKAPEGAATGAGSGAILGGTLGLLAGIGALAIPGVGPLIAAGPIMATLAGAGIGGAVGGVTGALVGMGIPEYEAKRYEGRLQKGGILLSVHCDTSEEIKRAKEIMQRTGGEDIASAGEASVDTDKTDRPDATRAAAR
jgi:tetrahydromethanopterin S-methyltransferase subunit C